MDHRVEGRYVTGKVDDGPQVILCPRTEDPVDVSGHGDITRVLQRHRTVEVSGRTTNGTMVMLTTIVAMTMSNARNTVE